MQKYINKKEELCYEGLVETFLYIGCFYLTRTKNDSVLTDFIYIFAKD